MNSEATCTNFKIQHINYSATCIETYIACKNFSALHKMMTQYILKLACNM